MAELGQSDDPRALIPGDPGSVGDAASAMAVYGELLHDAAAGLRRIDTADGWSGDAADGFRRAFRGHPQQWQRAGDAFRAAASALDAYTSALSEAQQQAAEAIRLWDQGQAATSEARAQQAEAQQRAQQDAATRTASGIPTVAPAVAFIDAGEPMRQQARRVLAGARSRLKGAGDSADREVGAARDKAPKAPSIWSKIGSGLAEVGHAAEDVGAKLGNGLASFGNAAAHHPGDMFLAEAGMLLTAVSASGEGLGLLLDATGVGALAGVPLNVVSSIGMTAGLGITTVAMADIGRHAAGDDQVSSTDAPSGGGSAGGEPVDPPGDPGQSRVTEAMIRDAMQDAPLKSQQGAVSLPRVQHFLDLLRSGTDVAPIRVDGDIIVEGNHRYVASRVAGAEPPQSPWSGGRPDRVVPWDQQVIDPASWQP